jgi:predicted small metal-binding protein
MAKAIRCGDIVPGCEFVARGKDEDEVLARAAEHAKKDHGMESIPDEVLAKAKAVIREE